MSEHTDRGVSRVLQALNWAYEKASSTLPGLGSAEDLARRHLNDHNGDRERAIADLIRWQVGYAGAAGFVSNLGGAITLPVSVPAGLASVLLIQLRMITAIAYLRGYKLTDPRVRTMAFVCLTGKSAARVVSTAGVSFASQALLRIPTAALNRVNQAVGVRLVTQAGASGLINLSKFVPIFGGVIGGSVDAAITRAVAAAARKVFPPTAAA